MIFVSHASDEFWELYRSLPPDVQKQADKQFDLFRQNPLHPSLHLKPIGHVWSARVNQAYRVLGYREGAVFYWFWIGSHQEYERVLGR
ncbi:MAG TPA: hypothetical protein VNY30_12365 [Bryobacteraceae bacterium]|nr:hypothetical protein [Bryobacteraceae bacterium]